MSLMIKEVRLPTGLCVMEPEFVFVVADIPMVVDGGRGLVGVMIAPLVVVSGVICLKS